MKKQLSKSEIKKLNEQLTSAFGLAPFDKKQQVELYDKKFIVVDGVVQYFYEGDDVYPTIRTLLAQQVLPAVTVDMGAVRFVTKGADVMRPGITHIPDGLDKGACVVIQDETHNKPLSIGIMLYDSKEMQTMDGGKVIKIIHYVGDDIWNYSA